MCFCVCMHAFVSVCVYMLVRVCVFRFFGGMRVQTQYKSFRFLWDGWYFPICRASRVTHHMKKNTSCLQCFGTPTNSCKRYTQHTLFYKVLKHLLHTVRMHMWKLSCNQNIINGLFRLLRIQYCNRKCVTCTVIYVILFVCLCVCVCISVQIIYIVENGTGKVVKRKIPVAEISAYNVFVTPIYKTKYYE